jgi:uncharacterized protein (TIGR00369 family)
VGSFAGERPTLLVMDTGPERTFGVTRPVIDGAGATAGVSGSMLTGPWLNGPAGIAPGGTLGVLIDGVSACAALLGAPSAAWSVSAEISLDMCGPMPADESMLSARARSLHADEDGGLSAGTVTDGRGRTVALYRQRTRWVKGPSLGTADVGAADTAVVGTAVPGATVSGTAGGGAVEVEGREFQAPGQVPAVFGGPGGPADLTELLDARIQAADGGAIVELPVTGDLSNPLGNAHGGVIFTAVDLAAQAALLSVDGPTRTESVRVSYLRPVPGGTSARFEARVAHRGRTLGLVQVTALNEKGKPAVIATVTTARN